MFFSVCRFQCHAVQEKPHACGALLQSCTAPDGAGVRPPADSSSAVAGKNPGRQRKQALLPFLCSDRVMWHCTVLTLCRCNFTLALSAAYCLRFAFYVYSGGSHCLSPSSQRTSSSALCRTSLKDWWCILRCVCLSKISSKQIF